MKKVLFAIGLATFGCIGAADAQLQKGNTTWGGSITDMNFGLKSGQGWNIGITPRVGYFIKDNVLVGGYGDLNLSKAGSGNPTKSEYGIGAFSRYYAKPGDVNNLLNHGRFFAEANAGFGGSSQKGQPTTNGFAFGFGPGYSYFLTPSIGLEGLVKYNGIVGGGNTTYQHNITFGIGFQVYLPSSKIKAMAKDPKSL
ncbi:hypothetical protein [Rhizosphaericola mali]|uniref:Porin family protein n=1 Tax=Rhizosphaericola mali TaxID=2545455 RepID=A0A5P2FWG4_9BACT|nr:hypothetical protein [Rhizosphaericola mali]QES87525.1 hypothetical protein E0W69_002205 [Rhizosphaericola mali]